ncbi:MAG TPA: FprA family A-type flavoprotein [Candidatus Ratteibacteria bacterium]|nr:FprA family A-type flavoprotein [bacterium]HRS06638.1 FprA family A-type flavoprotein [Candidatus Ratteibacteria bacterium]HRV04795.1 FprA family A-type flavoprotein [Candidatus Ratteibacteria bacterium]
MKISDGIFSVGAIDWDLKTFHGYSTPYGTTYNAYLIKGEKNILIDTVKHYCADEFISNISKVLPVDRIDYVICNHAEMDHSGLINYILSMSNATLICSSKCKDNLQKHFHKDYQKIINVEHGQELKIGNNTFKFFHTPMVHWPESMATYLIERKILFPNDAFGQHIANSKLYVDEIGLEIVLREAQKYYANIVNPYGNAVQKVLEALNDLPVEIIAPSHGMIWRRKQDIEKIIQKYSMWAANKPGNEIIIVYETMWGSTKKMAEECFLKAVEKNYPVKMFNLEVKDISDVVAEMPDAKMILFGSSILHGQILPRMAGLLTYLTGLRFTNRKAWTFGSYGWSKPAFERFETMVKSAGFEFPGSGYYVQFVPDESTLKHLVDIFSEKILD